MFINREAIAIWNGYLTFGIPCKYIILFSSNNVTLCICILREKWKKKRYIGLILITLSKYFMVEIHPIWRASLLFMKEALNYSIELLQHFSFGGV